MSLPDDLIFPDCVALNSGFIGGPAFLTDIVISESGEEFRTPTWPQGLRRYEASHAARLPEEYGPLGAFFEICMGKAYPFLLKDWLDYKHSDKNGSGFFTELTSTTFQMWKRYTINSVTRDRRIQKPKSGTITVTGGTVSSIDLTTGIVTMTSGTPTAWAGEFYVPCRFDTDEMKPAVIEKKPTGELFVDWMSIPIVEIVL